MNFFETCSVALVGVPLAIPLGFALAATTARRRAEAVSVAMLAVAVLTCAWAVFAPAPLATALLRVDVVTGLMLPLVCGIGLVIVRYSLTCLEGEPRIDGSLRWLLFTLSAATTIVIANNLLIIGVAWTLLSVAVHRLLTFFPDRSAALVAAHKKFLVSRLADLSLFAGIAITQATVGSLRLDELSTWAEAQRALPPSMQVAAVLVVLAVALRSAQLPFHGWLTQVMEAPTPVSALLHAGVVNIGGFVLIRLAPWMARAAPAQALMIVIGLTTAVVASLVMTTRVSIKVALAWSTIAQMGFMLVQCGLGAWHLALLHLVAHSLYKAHAFLSAGSVVERWRVQSLREQVRPSSARVGAAAVAAVVVGAACVVGLDAVGLVAIEHMSTWVLALLASFSLVPLLSRQQTSAAFTMRAIAAAGGVAVLLCIEHASAAALLSRHDAPEDKTAWVIVGVAFVGLFIAKSAVLQGGRFARAAYPWLFAGFFLDERFTRWTFRIWPPRLAPRGPRAVALESLEVAS